MDIRFENISNPWSAGARVVQPWLHREPRRREREAALPLGRPAPRYLLFSNPRRRNRWGHRRTFRLQLSSHAGPVLPRGWREERGVTWARWGTKGSHGVGTGLHGDSSIARCVTCGSTLSFPWARL